MARSLPLVGKQMRKAVSKTPVVTILACVSLRAGVSAIRHTSFLLVNEENPETHAINLQLWFRNSLGIVVMTDNPDFLVNPPKPRVYSSEGWTVGRTGSAMSWWTWAMNHLRVGPQCLAAELLIHSPEAVGNVHFSLPVH